MKQTKSERFAAAADKFEARSLDPCDKDAPGWLKKIASKFRQRAIKKEKAIEHRRRQGKPGILR